MHYYDKAGQLISLEEYACLHADIDYLRIAKTEIGPYVVSTVWLGLDHNWGEGPPIIFETMVFTSRAWHGDRSDPDRDPMSEIDCARYSTEHMARIGHEEMCLMVRATYQEVEPSQEAQNPPK